MRAGSITSIKGLGTVMTNLEKEILKIKASSMQGLMRVSILIHRDTEQSYPKTPVDTGFLRASWKAYPVRSVFGPSIVFGFTAKYAMYVHENVGAQFSGRAVSKSTKSTKKKEFPGGRPQSGAKFFETSIKNKTPEIIKILTTHTKIR